MAAKRQSTRRAPTTARRPAAAKRKPTRRAQRQPMLESHQLADLAGLALVALGAFSVLVLWLGLDGAALGRGLRHALEQMFGRGVGAAPILLCAAGVSLLLRSDPRRIRPFRFGGAAIVLGLASLIGSASLSHAAVRSGGGIFGNGLHTITATVAGEPGAFLVALFLVLGGLLLVSGASAAAVLGQGAYVARRSADNVVRVAATVRPVTPSRPLSVRAPRIRGKGEAVPLDGEARFPDVFEETAPDPEPTPLSAQFPVEPLTFPPLPVAPVEVLDADPTDAGELTLETDGLPLGTSAELSTYVLPDPSVLRKGTQNANSDVDATRVSQTLIAALKEHGIEARLSGTVSGPRVTRYELQLAAGTKLSRFSALKDDLSYALASTEIRLLTPIPGKQAVGVEVPNRSPNLVALGDLVGQMPEGHSPLSVWLGKDIAGHTVSIDLTRMPHLLIAGTTGSGKSGCINAMLSSILLRATPDEVKMILIDPKKVELNHYETIPHLLTPVVTNMKNASAVLSNVVREMESRYELMGSYKARSLIEMNRLRLKDGKPKLPYILVVIDELADLMMVAPGEVEDAIVRLAQKSRAVGIHLLLATQRPSRDVITGLIKANVPSRIAFAVSSQIDSRIILDEGGAESLLGSGDMLYKSVSSMRLQRVQGAYIDEEEIALVVAQCRRQAAPKFEEELLETLPDVESEELDADEDELLSDAILCVAQHETASVSLLQRKLRVGYTRAGRLIDMLERRGVVTGYEGSKARRVLVSYDEAQRMVGRETLST